MVTPWLTFAVSVLGVLIIPALVLLWRMAVNDQRDRDQMTQIAKDMENLVKDKDRVHAELYNQMREDRKATNSRLRWLEENMWGKMPHGNNG